MALAATPCAAVGKRDRSGPSSANRTRAVLSPIPGISVRSVPNSCVRCRRSLYEELKRADRTAWPVTRLAARAQHRLRDAMPSSCRSSATSPGGLLVASLSNELAAVGAMPGAQVDHPSRRCTPRARWQPQKPASSRSTVPTICEALARMARALRFPDRTPRPAVGSGHRWLARAAVERQRGAAARQCRLQRLDQLKVRLHRRQWHNGPLPCAIADPAPGVGLAGTIVARMRGMAQHPRPTIHTPGVNTPPRFTRKPPRPATHQSRAHS